MVLERGRKAQEKDKRKSKGKAPSSDEEVPKSVKKKLKTQVQ